MKILLPFLLTMPMIGSPMAAVNFFEKESVSNKLFVKDIISEKFQVLGEWQTADDDRNKPDWSSSIDEPYAITYAKVIKKSSYYPSNLPKIEFDINFENLGGNYDNAKWAYNLNDFSKVRLNFKTQAGQPAHNKDAGWPETDESWTLLDLINNGVSNVHKGNFYPWGEWAGLNHRVNSLWNSDKSILTITWDVTELRLKATKWSNGLYFKLDLTGIEQEIHKI